MEVWPKFLKGPSYKKRFYFAHCKSFYFKGIFTKIENGFSDLLYKFAYNVCLHMPGSLQILVNSFLVFFIILVV